jgi:hypothetical protein
VQVGSFLEAPTGRSERSGDAFPSLRPGDARVRPVFDLTSLSSSYVSVAGGTLLDGPPVTVRIVEEGEGVEHLQITLYWSEPASLLVV